MYLPAQNLLAWEICVTLFHLLVVGCTSVRLVHRWRARQMWWDDYTAFLPLTVDVIYVIIMWLRFRDGVAGVTEHKFKGFFSSDWFAVALGWIIVWGSRFSLSLSIARIFPEKHICRRFSFGLSIAFFLSGVMILLSSALTCKTKEGAWYDLNFNRPNCLKQRGVQIVALLCILVLNFAADILLVVTPLVMLWKVKLPTKERRLILVLFGTNVVSLFSSIIFAVIWYLVADHGAKFIILASMFTLLQAGIGLLICNLLVITMLIYRYTRRNFEDEVHASRSSSPPVTTHHTATSNNDVISESSADEKSNEQPMLLTSIYQTFSGISSAPPATASSFQDPEPLPVSYVA